LPEHLEFVTETLVLSFFDEGNPRQVEEVRADEVPAGPLPEDGPAARDNPEGLPERAVVFQPPDRGGSCHAGASSVDVGTQFFPFKSVVPFCPQLISYYCGGNVIRPALLTFLQKGRSVKPLRRKAWLSLLVLGPCG
jgi:hypothetical protein